MARCSECPKRWFEECVCHKEVRDDWSKRAISAAALREIKDAAVLLEEAARNPQMDEFFARMPPLSKEDFIAITKKNRRDRASWGGVDQSDETVDQ